jgi:hypothetical protein
MLAEVGTWAELTFLRDKAMQLGGGKYLGITMIYLYDKLIK